MFPWRFDHLAIAVRDIDAATEFFVGKLGAKPWTDKYLDEALNVFIVEFMLGEVIIELVQDARLDGPVSSYIEKRGEGIQHLSLEVSDIEGALQTLKEKGMPLIDEKPRIGAGGHKIAFVHPKGSKALVELTEPRE